VPGASLSHMDFRGSLESLIVELRALIVQAPTSPTVIHAQLCTLKQFADLCRVLQPVCEPAEIGAMINALLLSVPMTSPALNDAKLLLVWELIESGLLKLPALRAEVLATIVRIVIVHLPRSKRDREVALAILMRVVLIVEAAKDVDECWTVAVCLPELVIATGDLLEGRTLPDAAVAAAEALQEVAAMDTPQLAARVVQGVSPHHSRSRSSPAMPGGGGAASAGSPAAMLRERYKSTRPPSIKLQSGEVMQIHLASAAAGAAQGDASAGGGPKPQPSRTPQGSADAATPASLAHCIANSKQLAAVSFLAIIRLLQRYQV
jgi:hypothetical protein